MINNKTADLDIKQKFHNKQNSFYNQIQIHLWFIL